MSKIPNIWEPYSEQTLSSISKLITNSGTIRINFKKKLVKSEVESRRHETRAVSTEGAKYILLLLNRLLNISKQNAFISICRCILYSGKKKVKFGIYRRCVKNTFGISATRQTVDLYNIRFPA